MFKKRVIILFFSIFLVNLHADNDKSVSDKKLIDDVYKNDNKQFYVEGLYIVKDKQTNFYLYKEKNKNDFYNLSLKIEDDLYKVVSTETKNLLNINKTNIEGDKFLEGTNIAVDILNYSLLNRDYIVLGKPDRTSFKNIPVYKILIKEKKPVPIIVEEIIEEEVISETKDDTKTEEVSDDIEEKTDDEKSDDEDDNKTDKKSKDDNKTDKTSEDKKVKTVIKAPVITYEPAKYKKVVYYVGEKNMLTLKKEFYIKKEDKKPAFIIEAESVKYINGKYLVTEYKVTNVKKRESITLKYNIETILYDKDQITDEQYDVKYFNGVE